MKVRHLAIPLIAIGLLTGCAATTPGDENASYDPLEGFNRTMFTFNNVADEYVLEPVAKGYRAVLPEDLRNSFRNELRHLQSPIDFANQLLQGDFTGAFNVVARFVINTLVGVGGLVDVASMNGMPYEGEDFGQTLAVWGLGDGPYLVLPLLGSSNLRDFGGTVVDTAADPVSIAAHNHNEGFGYTTDITRVTLNAVDKRSRVIEAVDDARKNSVDYYATVRSFYKQQRDSDIRDGRVDNDIPDFDMDGDASQNEQKTVPENDTKLK